MNEFGGGIQQESNGRSATLKGKVGEGPTLHITSTRGSITIRKEGSTPAEGTGDRAAVNFRQSAAGSLRHRSRRMVAAGADN